MPNLQSEIKQTGHPDCLTLPLSIVPVPEPPSLVVLCQSHDPAICSRMVVLPEEKPPNAPALWKRVLTWNQYLTQAGRGTCLCLFASDFFLQLCSIYFHSVFLTLANPLAPPAPLLSVVDFILVALIPMIRVQNPSVLSLSGPLRFPFLNLCLAHVLMCRNSITFLESSGNNVFRGHH